MEFEKHLIQNAVEGTSFAEKYGCQPPSSFPCVAVAVEVDPDPRPCYWEVEYVYRTEFETLDIRTAEIEELEPEEPRKVVASSRKKRKISRGNRHNS